MTCLKPEGALPGATGTDGLDFNAYDRMEPRKPNATPAPFRNGKPVKDANISPAGLYRPDYRVMTPHMRSPEFVQMSTAAAITLGLVEGQMHGCSCTRCLNLLLTYPEGCRANCAYCGLARHRESERNYADRNFIRVDWPAVSMDEIVDRIASDVEGTPFHRMCISMITHPNSDEDTVTVLKKWTDRIDPDAIPISILSNPTTMTRDDVQRLRDMGSDIFTVALDAATPELFDRTRGKGVQSPHTWKKYWDTLLEARDIFGPQKFGAHIIVGMGETLHDRARMLQVLANLPEHPESVPINQLVAVPGTPLADAAPVDPFDFVRMIAVARIVMPASFVRLSAGRESMSDELQALAFLAGANSIFYGEKLLTTGNPDWQRDQALLGKLGMTTS